MANEHLRADADETLLELEADRVVRMDVDDVDPEKAHILADQVLQDGLQWVVDHSTDERAVLVALVALRVTETSGIRWYA